MQNGEIILRPVTGDDVARIIAATRDGNHGCHAPTHVFERLDPQSSILNPRPLVVGYASINAIPFLTGWFSEEHIDRVEARQCLAAMEQIAAEGGARVVVTPCTEDCRFMRNDDGRSKVDDGETAAQDPPSSIRHPRSSQMQEMGYTAAGKVTLYFKNLNA